MPSKAPRATWPFSGWPNLTMAGKIMENLPNWRFQLEVWRIHGIWSPLACLMRLFALGRRWFCFFGSKMIRWFWSCLVKTCCLWSKDLPSCAGKYPAPQLGALQFFANGPLLQLRNWDLFGKSNDFFDFSDSSKSQGWLGYWPWQHDSMTQLSPWGLGLCQWSEVHLPRRAKVEQVEQYPKPSSFRRLKKGLPNFAQLLFGPVVLEFSSAVLMQPSLHKCHRPVDSRW